MSAFNNLLSSLGGAQKEAGPQASPRPATAANAPRPVNSANSSRPATPGAVAAPLKRKAEESGTGPPFKQVKTEQNGTTPRPPMNKAQSSPALKSSTSGPTTAVPYRGTAKPSGPATNPVKSAAKPAPKPTTSGTSTPTPVSAPDGASKAAAKKGGFASVLEKAKAAQEAAKAAGNGNVIKHKPLEKTGKLSTKERLRREQEERAKQKLVGKPGIKAAAAAGRVNNRSRSGTPSGAEAAQSRKRVVVPEPGYKGTMRKASEAPAYKGTLGKQPSGQDRARPGANKHGAKRTLDSLGKSEYGGYASWSDLDDEDDEEGYGSDGSSDMEAGIDDVEEEEAAALRAAKREDLEEQAREEAHQREKAERRRRLEAMAKAAKGKQKF